MELAKHGLPGLSATQGTAQYLALANDPHAPVGINKDGRADALRLLVTAGPVETLAREMRSYLRDYPDITTNQLNPEIFEQATKQLGSSDPELTQQLTKILLDVEGFSRSCNQSGLRP